MWLVSLSEPPIFHALGRCSGIPERYGVDFWTGGLVGVQRKTVPDLVASIEDGRLSKELSQMQALRVAALVLEGELVLTSDGYLLQAPGWHYRQIVAVLWSVQLVYGVLWWATKTPEQTLETVRAFGRWVEKREHASFRRRPKHLGLAWGTARSREWAAFLLQSFPGVGPKTAEAIYDALGLPLRWTVGEKELREIPGVGPKTARSLVRALQGEVEDVGPSVRTERRRRGRGADPPSELRRP